MESHRERRSYAWYVANYAFRAVRLPAGKAEVVFSYEPASYRLGLFLGLLSLALTLGLLVGAVTARPT